MTPWVKEGIELVALSIGAFFLAAFLAQRFGRGHTLFDRNRLLALAGCAAAVVLAQVSEEVLGRESGALDRAVLIRIHAASPPAAHGVFHALTVSASASVVMPVAAAIALWLGLRRHWRGAAQLVATILASSASIYLVKTAVARPRPSIWDTQWYWGSSFPSGHTLTAAGFATCLCLLASRLRLGALPAMVVVSALWVAGVALSRLVLGVHWPTDVVAAACAGFLIAIGVDAAVRRWPAHGSRHPAGQS